MKPLFLEYQFNDESWHEYAPMNLNGFITKPLVPGHYRIISHEANGIDGTVLMKFEVV